MFFFVIPNYFFCLPYCTLACYFFSLDTSSPQIARRLVNLRMTCELQPLKLWLDGRQNARGHVRKRLGCTTANPLLLIWVSFLTLGFDWQNELRKTWRTHVTWQSAKNAATGFVDSGGCFFFPIWTTADIILPTATSTCTRTNKQKGKSQFPCRTCEFFELTKWTICRPPLKTEIAFLFSLVQTRISI